MSFANKYGFKKTIKFSLGVSAGFFVLALMCSIFNLLLISILPIIKLPLTILGVGYILYLAYKTLTSKSIHTKRDLVWDYSCINLYITLLHFLL